MFNAINLIRHIKKGIPMISGGEKGGNYEIGDLACDHDSVGIHKTNISHQSLINYAMHCVNKSALNQTF